MNHDEILNEFEDFIVAAMDLIFKSRLESMLDTEKEALGMAFGDRFLKIGGEIKEVLSQRHTEIIKI